MGNRLFRMVGPTLLALVFASPARAIGPCSTDWSDVDHLGANSGSTKAPSWPLDVTPPGAVSTAKFNAVHGRSRPNGGTVDKNNVWAVGDNGVIIKYNGTSWSLVASPVSDVNLYDVYILPKANTDGMMGFAVGERGTILGMDSGGTWSIINHPDAGDCGNTRALPSAKIPICATLYDIFPVDPSIENTALYAIGHAQLMPPDDCSWPDWNCPASDWGDNPTILKYSPGVGWIRLTSTSDGAQEGNYDIMTGLAYTGDLPTSFTGIIGAFTGPTSPTKGIILDSLDTRFTRSINPASLPSVTWKKRGATASFSFSPAPRYYASANIGSHMVYFGDTDTDNYYNGAIAGGNPTTNMFCYMDDGNPIMAVNTGMAAAQHGTVRAADYLPLWGFGIGVGFGKAGGAGYAAAGTATGAYLMLISVAKPDRLPEPEDAGSGNTVQYWQSPKWWPRLNGCFIAASTEAWAVGDNGTILHWMTPLPPPTVLDVTLTASRTGMWVAVVMNVKNTGGTPATSLATAMTPAPGSAYLECAQICSATHCDASVPCGSQLAPGGDQNFTWSYTLTGWYPATFTGKADAIDFETTWPVTDTSSVTVSPPARAQLSVTVNPYWPNSHIFKVTMTVTNTGFKDANTVTPGPTLAGAPPGAVLVAGPLPASAGPLGVGANTTFVYTYSATGNLPWTFSGCGDLSLDGGETVTACADVTSPMTESNPLKAAMSIETIRGGVDIFYSTVTLTITNTGTEDVTNVDLTVADPTPVIGSSVTNGAMPALSPLIPAGSSTSFSWTYNVKGSLGYTFVGCGAGTTVSKTPVRVCAQAAANSAFSPLKAALSVSAIQAGATFYIATVIMTVTNEGTENAITLDPAWSLAAPANSHVDVSPASSPGPLLPGPGNAMSFTWKYTTPATIPLTFSGSITAVGSPSTANLYASATGTANFAFSPLLGALTVTAVQSGPSSYFGTVIMTVTNNNKTENVVNLVPVMIDPHGSTLAGGPWVNYSGSSPAYSGNPPLFPWPPVPGSSVKPGESANFTWWYVKNGPMPMTFDAGVSAQEESTGLPEYGSATGSVFATIIPSPISAAVTASMVQSGPASYYCTIDLMVTNNGSDTYYLVTPDWNVSTAGGVSTANKVASPPPNPNPSTSGMLIPSDTTKFTYKYNVTGTPPFYFTGCAAASLAAAPPVPAHDVYSCATAAASDAASLLNGAISVTTNKACPGISYDYYFEVVMTITNTGGEGIYNLSPGAALTVNPATVSLLSSPSLTPIGDPDHPIPKLPSTQSSRAFTWSYTATGSLPFDFKGNATATTTPTGIPVFGEASGSASSSKDVLTFDSAMSATAEFEEKIGLAGRWKVTVVMTVTNSGKASVTDFVMSVIPSPAGRAFQTSGPRYSAAWTGSMPANGGFSSFSWSFTCAGKADLTFDGAVCAKTMPAGVPAYTSCSTKISLGDTGTPGLYVINRNLFRGRSESVVASFNLKEGGATTLSVYNSIGQRVRVLFKGYADARLDYDFPWDGTNDNGERVASGAYYIRIEGRRFVATKKVAFIK